MCLYVSILGLLENDPATVPDGLPWAPCNFIYDFTSIFSFINIHEYANEIILYMTTG